MHTHLLSEFRSPIYYVRRVILLITPPFYYFLLSKCKLQLQTTTTTTTTTMFIFYHILHFFMVVDRPVSRSYYSWLAHAHHTLEYTRTLTRDPVKVLNATRETLAAYCGQAVYVYRWNKFLESLRFEPHTG